MQTRVLVAACLAVIAATATPAAQRRVRREWLWRDAGFVEGIHAATRRASSPATVNNNPIVLAGTETLVISDPDYTIKNDITLWGSSTLIIRNSTFTHASDYSGQYTLVAHENSKVIIENSTIKSSDWIGWGFWDDSVLQMTNVTNDRSKIWHAFLHRARTSVVAVSLFHGYRQRPHVHCRRSGADDIHRRRVSARRSR